MDILMGNNMFKTLLKISNYYESKAKKILSIAESKRTWDLKYLLGPEDFNSDSRFGGGDESEGYASVRGSDVSIALKETGAKAIPRGQEGSPVLGQGAFGVVFDVVYEGKQSAMKITKQQYEFEIYEEIQRAYNSFPNFIKRHLPKIYLTKELEGTQAPVYVIIMEHLAPLPTGLKLQGWGDNYEKNNKDVMYITNQLIKHVVTNIIPWTNEYIYEYAEPELAKLLVEEYKTIVTQSIIQVDYNKLFKFDPQSLEQNQHYIYKFIQSKVYIALNTAINIIEHKANQIEQKDLKDQLLSQINTFKQNNYAKEITLDLIDEFFLSRNFLSIESGDDFNIPDPVATFKDPRLAKLYFAVSWLDKQGITVKDMHSDNVLYRPSTDDLVISDVGLWEI